MARRSVLRASDEEQSKVYETLVSAFTDDPVERWLYPETADYLEHFPRFLRAFGGRAFDAQTVWQVEQCAAVAMWFSPGTEPDGDSIGAVLSETVDPAKHDDAFAVLEQMDAAHPTETHWYLPWLGVDARRQGHGLGALLLAQCLVVVDEDHLPVFLETPNPRNIPFYERHGFEVTGKAQAGSCPPVTFMWRAAR